LIRNLASSTAFRVVKAAATSPHSIGIIAIAVATDFIGRFLEGAYVALELEVKRPDELSRPESSCFG